VGVIETLSWQLQDVILGISGSRRSICRWPAACSVTWSSGGASSGIDIFEYYRRVDVRDSGTETETRAELLGIPTAKDRVVQAALKNILEPVFEAS
jgi:hypothetical protein